MIDSAYNLFEMFQNLPGEGCSVLITMATSCYHADHLSL